jgi:serine/threonine-protein kinase
MATRVRCPQGHQWDVPVRETDAAPEVTCPVCGAAVEGLVDQESSTVLAGERTLLLPPMAALTDSPPAPVAAQRPAKIGNYEVLGILGRGGMGVVYKAFHLSLKRVVALKMLVDVMAEANALARFRTEAEAVAQLQHPHITQIYEIGEHEGRPYLSLEYVDGDTLSKKLTRMLPMPREAAQLVEVLARAMHFAHKRGIIHRDLKPSNVLLTKEGVPKISDFGLAKHTRQGSDFPGGAVTRTGDVLGTPNYMAPEQASGLAHLIGPCTDVYALGIILYEMLTGRPPILADTPIEALRRVVQEEPAPPSRLQPRVPRDLETICLRCLEKKPQRRYLSAEALADDLRAFLAGDAIKARPASRGERLARWLRRKPTTAVLVTVAAVALIGVLIGVWMHSAVAVGGVAVLSLLLAAWWYNARLQAALRDLAQQHSEAEHNAQRLHFLLETTRRLMAAAGVDDLLAILGETTTRLVNAERATIYVVDAGKAELWSRVAMGDDVGEIRVPMGTGIAGMVALTGETINVLDAYTDVRFNAEVDRRTGYRTRNLLTVPVRSSPGTIIGVFQVLNKRQGDFTREDVELLLALAASAGVALQQKS